MKLLLFFCTSMLLLPLPARADLRVWSVADTRHVLRSEPAGTNLAARLAAARGEWVSFQILLRADTAVAGVRVESGDLLTAQGARLARFESRLYRQHQVHLETGTYRNDTFHPDWYPDALIPFEHPLAGHQLTHARLRAIPFDVPANETHGFWVDLHVPTNAAAGNYLGTYHVIAANSAAIEVPVTLTVWDFMLPETPSLVTAFGSPAAQLRSYYRRTNAVETAPATPVKWTEVEEQCAELLATHRVNATPPGEMLRPVRQADGTFRIPAAHIAPLRGFIDKYHVNAVQTPHPASVIKDPASEQDLLRSWLGAFTDAAKELDRPVLFFTYLKDEPNTMEDYRYVQNWGRAVRNARSAAKVMVVEQPWTELGQGGADSAWGDLFGAVVIWCPLFSLHRPEAAARRQALGENIWTYTALCQGKPTPWWHIDFPLLNYRVPAWMAWRDRMTGLLYWGGMAYWHETPDPWTEAPVYTGRGAVQQGRKGLVFNGEGSLVYPARAVGYDGMVPTIRLKALRDGIEDYEYLAILDRLGKGAEARALVRRLTSSFFEWQKDSSAYEHARAELAQMILSQKKG